MAYATGKTCKQQLATAGMVAILHVGIGAGLLAAFAGVTGTIVERWVPDVHNIPIDPPPPPPTDLVEKPRPAETVLTAPRPPIDIVPVDPGTLVIPDSGLKPAGPIAPPGGGGTGIVEPSPSPSASFVPRVAKPRTNPGTWATTIDYPPRDLRAGNEGTTAFRVTVGTDGRVTECMIIRSSGFQGLDEATCAKVAKRARFEPATDASGNPVAGSYANSIRWEIPE